MTDARAYLVGYAIVAFLMLRQGLRRIVLENRMESYEPMELFAYAALWPLAIVLMLVSIAKGENPP